MSFNRCTGAELIRVMIEGEFISLLPYRRSLRNMRVPVFSSFIVSLIISVSGKAEEFKREINTRSRQQRILKLRCLWPSQSHKVINNPLFTGAEIRRSEQV